MASTPSPLRSSCVHAALQHIRTLDLTHTPPAKDYPPTSSIPRTSSERLTAASTKEHPNTAILPSSSPTAAPYLATGTVLYLAYGSNLCAQTFLGARGIRPISATNVSVPALRLTFDLPGLAYKEPCFANVAPRKIPKLPPGIPDHPPVPPPLFPPHAATAPTWDNGLIGVVYEVTPEDYATIVRTEGGGASYKDVLVPCIAVPSRPPGIPEKPPVPELPKPFWAHTLYAPRIPTKPGDGDGDDGSGGLDDGDDDGDCNGPIDKLKEWWKKMLLKPLRADPDYAQPSARYLKLIVDGAAEHELPIEYQRWLRSLQPYTITSRLQALGQFLFLALIAPVVMLSFGLGKVLADENGQVPLWFALLMETFFHLVWGAYDRVFKPVFGDGERTVEGDDGDGAKHGHAMRRLARREYGVDEEKANLVDV